MRSKFFALNPRDFFKGLVVAIITAVVTYVYEAIQTGVVFDVAFLKSVGLTALAAFLSYIIKNFLTNTQGQILTKEPN